MGFLVRVEVVLNKPPNEHLMEALDHQFGSATHERGTKVVALTEHVSMPNETDALEFVRALVLEAVPEGSRISALTADVD